MPLQTKVTCSPLGNFTHFPLVRKTTTKDDVPLLGSIVFLSVGRRPVCAASFASLAHVPVHLQRRDAPCAARKGISARREKFCDGAEHLLRPPRIAHTTGMLQKPPPMAFCTPSRASARSRVQCFLFFACTPSPLLQLLRFQLVTDEKNGEGKVKVVKVGLATACDSMRYERLLTFCRVRRKHKVRCFSKMGR